MREGGEKFGNSRRTYTSSPQRTSNFLRPTSEAYAYRTANFKVWREVSVTSEATPGIPPSVLRGWPKDKCLPQGYLGKFSDLPSFAKDPIPAKSKEQISRSRRSYEGPPPERRVAPKTDELPPIPKPPPIVKRHILDQGTFELLKANMFVCGENTYSGVDWNGQFVYFNQLRCVDVFGHEAFAKACQEARVYHDRQRSFESVPKSQYGKG